MARGQRLSSEKLNARAKNRLAAAGFISICKADHCANGSDREKLVDGFCKSCREEAIRLEETELKKILAVEERKEEYGEEHGAWS